MILCASNYKASYFHPHHISIKLLHLYQGKNFVLHNGRGIVFRRNDLNHNSINKVPGGDESMEAITTVLHTGLKYLDTEEEKCQEQGEPMK